MTEFLDTRVGEYRLVERLGSGGMGEVYRAVHETLGRTVAIKVLTEALEDPSFVERFLNEARIQASLVHPNIVTLFDFIQVGGRPAIVMEFVDGETIADHLRQNGPMPLKRVLVVFRAVVDAVRHVHSHGIVHRDIKAHNVKLAADGTVKLLDFGIAKSSGSPRLTLKGQFIGTLHACAPEQLRGEAADERSDVWALGVLLYELLTGRVPFDADSVGEFVRKVDAGTFAPPSSRTPDVPAAVDALVARCLEAQRERRFASAADLLTAVDGLAHGSRARAAFPTPPTSPWKAPDVVGLLREQWPLAAAVVVLAVVLTAAVLARGRSQPVTVPTGLSRTSPAVTGASSDEPAVGTATVSIGLVGASAEVWVNHRPVGTTPCRFSAQIGREVEVVLKVPGYRPLAKRLEVLPHSNEYVYSVQELQPR